MADIDFLTVENSMLALYKTGSQAYGLALPESDTDFQGTFIRPLETYLFTPLTVEQKEGPWPNSSQFPQISNAKDITVYEIKKMVHLLAKGNPNKIELLFPTADTLIYKHDAWDIVLKNRHFFLTQEIRNTFVNYAYSQIKRLERHFKWLRNPPTAPPEPEDFGLVASQEMSETEFNAFIYILWELVRDRIEFIGPTEKFQELIREKIDYKSILINYEFPLKTRKFISQVTGTDTTFIETYQRLKQYRKSMEEWNQYQRWLTKRNPKRAQLESKIGYDCKHGVHCLRLLYQANDLIQTGSMEVNTSSKPYHSFLLKVRNAKVPYNTFQQTAKSMFQLVRNLDISHLPEKVDDYALAQLVMEIHDAYKN